MHLKIELTHTLILLQTCNQSMNQTPILASPGPSGKQSTQWIVFDAFHSNLQLHPPIEVLASKNSFADVLKHKSWAGEAYTLQATVRLFRETDKGQFISIGTYPLRIYFQYTPPFHILAVYCISFHSFIFHSVVQMVFTLVSTLA